MQDDLTLVANRLVLTAGTRLEHNDFTGLEVQPTVRLLWTPSPRRSAWASVSRAVRTPSIWKSAIDMNVADEPLPDGTLLWTNISKAEHLRSEVVLAYEAGYRTQALDKLAFDVAAFYQRYRHISSISLGEPYFSPLPAPHVIAPMQVSNLLNARTYGAEITSTFTPYPRWKLVGSYSWLRQITDAPPPDVFVFAGGDGDNPNHQFQVHSYLSLPHSPEMDTGIYHVGRLAVQPDSGYTRWDLRLGWRPKPSLELSVNGRNLLATPHYEFMTPNEVLVAGKVKRAVYGKVTWRF